MNVLVTGATGFVGGALAKRLQQMGMDVCATGRNLHKGKILEQQGVQFVAADLADTKKIKSLCAERDFVFHCGALSSPWGKYRDFYAANVIGTQNIVDGCLQHGVKRLIHVSTPSIYFNFRDRLLVKEDDPLPSAMVNSYAQTKLLAEKVVDRAFTAGLAVVTIRPRAIFGPGDQAILPRIIDALQQKRMPVIGAGKSIADLTYIDNVVDSLLLAQTSPRHTLGKKYNITNGEPVAMWPLIKTLCEELQLEYPKRQVSYGVALTAAIVVESLYKLLGITAEPKILPYSIALLHKNITLDISSAQRDLGYTPRVNIRDGLSHFITWWKNTHC
ncbi:NAD-dependent epimerase/dehydratase family protein [Candidatus Uabimicrobium amorphum]|uniref:3-beta hydroxysteroid dehydrogenase n=1 Tax=Uabimicrobium amorphum TaxID=2596890 RepID=A0A5S9IIB1_UABAM|nr:NAD-dependent epimerase/dehydratase family protein [Candidatus Uabimicrobium amorphum]BBM82071.1 3-beta hydroxysteroid dehydrogenase [Candidatus Uabimicrobium amorphum]